MHYNQHLFQSRGGGNHITGVLWLVPCAKITEHPTRAGQGQTKKSPWSPNPAAPNWGNVYFSSIWSTNEPKDPSVMKDQKKKVRLLFQSRENQGSYHSAYHEERSGSLVYLNQSFSISLFQLLQWVSTTGGLSGHINYNINSLGCRGLISAQPHLFSWATCNP